MTPTQYLEKIAQREREFLALGYNEWESKAMARLHDLSLPVTVAQLDLEDDDEIEAGLIANEVS